MFTQVLYTNNLEDGNPASVDLDSGTLFINKKMWKHLDSEKRKNILLHELGHYKLQTTCEFEADEFAFQNYIGFGGSPEESIKAIRETLTQNTPEQVARLEKRIIMAQEIDHTLSSRVVGFDGSIVDPTDPSGQTILVTPEVFEDMVADIAAEEAELAREDAELSNEIAQDDAFLASTYYSIQEKEQLIAWYRQTIDTARKDCEDYKRAKKTANCKQEWNVAMAQYQNELTGVQTDLSHLLSKRDQRYLIKQQKVARKTATKQARQEKRRLLAEAKAYKRITRADGKQFKMMSNALTAQILATQGIDQKGNMFASGMGAITDIANGITSIWRPASSGGANTPINGNATVANGNTTIYAIIAIAVVVLFVIMMKRK